MSDAFYHAAFSDPFMVEHLVRGFLPEAMATGLDFTRMARVNAKGYAEALDRSRRRREGDVIWRLPTHDGLDLFLYILVEFQSKTDRWMSVRAQIYQGLLWQQLIRERTLEADDMLPPVLLAVLYNGQARWSAPTTVSELIALPAGSPLWPFQPRARYHIIDMGTVDAAPEADRDNLARLLFRLEQRPSPEEFGKLIAEVVQWFEQRSGHGQIKELFTEMVNHAITGRRRGKAAYKSLEEIKEMLPTLVETWKQEWLTTGKLEGERSTLITLTEERFGALPETIRQRIETADSQRIEKWLKRLLRAGSLEDLFSSAG